MKKYCRNGCFGENCSNHHLLQTGKVPAQSTFTCSKLTIEVLEQDVKYVQSYQKRHQNDANGNHFRPCCNVSVVNFKHVIVSWVVM